MSQKQEKSLNLTISSIKVYCRSDNKYYQKSFTTENQRETSLTMTHFAKAEQQQILCGLLCKLSNYTD